MFEDSTHARLFGLAPGVDFPRAVVSGLRARMRNRPPEAIARVKLFVNTRRMARRVQSLFQAGEATFLPQIRLITDIANDQSFAGIPAPISPLARRLELSQLVRQLIKAEPDLASQDAAFDLADSLASLMEEMHGEGITPQAVADLDVAQHSAHWARSQKFLAIVQDYFGDGAALDIEARQRLIVAQLIRNWATEPPIDPVIVAGSTGSRGTTRMFMEAVSKLPQGAIILPGFDFEMPTEIWSQLDDASTGEDHPQFRFRALIQNLSLEPPQVVPWHGTMPVSEARNQLVSLALRPAPVTDQWLEDGPKLANVAQATKDVTLLEASSSRLEAITIALRLRKALEDGQTAALITPDRVLTRRVAAALQQWRIEPDDSAGIPLSQTAPGRFLRQTAQLMGRDVAPEKLLAILKHPLICSADRGEHLRRTRDLELELLRGGPPNVTRQDMLGWAEDRKEDVAAVDWVSWFWDSIDPILAATTAALSEQSERHFKAAERLSAGPGQDGSGTLWLEKPGEVAFQAIQSLRDAAPFGGDVSPQDYSDIMDAVLSQEEVRNPFTPHETIMIWGSLEARVQGAELVILAGLNEGIWPEAAKPDPWLNRKMRQDAGLLLPERRIGLSAHDFQQAIAAPEVWLTRATRDAEAETVPSRWLNRICNLMNGLPDGGKEAVDEMRSKGEKWLNMAAHLDKPNTSVPSAKRPSPQPPVAARPDRLSVTQIEKLIRDPYAIYARHILKLRPLTPLESSPDAPLRGQALHEVLRKFVADTTDDLPPDALNLLMQIADDVFLTQVPWPATRAMWRAKLMRAAPWFLEGEAVRRQTAQPLAQEVDGEAGVAKPPFKLHGRADRIDLRHDGRLVIYDYKTGALPSQDQQEFFDKQLPLLAAIAERGGFRNIVKTPVADTCYVGLGATLKEQSTTYDPGALDEVWQGLQKLIASYAHRERGYSARRAVHESRWDQDYDHLARFGEWEQTDLVSPEKVGP